MIFFEIAMCLFVCISFIQTIRLWKNGKMPLNMHILLIIAAFLAYIVISLWALFCQNPLLEFLLTHILFLVFVVFIILAFFYDKRNHHYKSESNVEIDANSRKPVDKAEPRKAVTYLVYLVIVLIPFTFTFWTQFEDIPTALRGNYYKLSGNARFVDYIDTTLYLHMDQGGQDTRFKTTSFYFQNIIEGQTYTVVYLPNSQYVIDILDANGISLLIRPK
jgi:hypothetical protein